MPYKAEISRVNPTCFLFLIDQSGSMSAPFGQQPTRKKADGVADAINRLLYGLVLNCARSEGIRNFFRVGVIGYGNGVAPTFGGPLAGRDLVPISEIAEKPLRLEERVKQVEDGAGGIVDQKVKFPVWFDPSAGGMTPMCQALSLAQQTIKGFLVDSPSCFPPIVFNITDGEATDGDPEPVAAALRGLTTDDSNVLLFNAHLSSRPDQPIEFPGSESKLPDDHAKRLFRMSSVLPIEFEAAARSVGVAVTSSERGFVFNADVVAVIRMLNFGTHVAQNQNPG